MPRWVNHPAPKLRGLRHNPFQPTIPYPYEDHIEGNCPRCGGAGMVLEQIDEDRFPEAVPCFECQTYCQECKKWVTAKNHQHP